MQITNEWRKSSKSGTGMDCVEVRRVGLGKIEVRNSKSPEAGTTIFTPSEWNAFTAGVKNGEFEV